MKQNIPDKIFYSNMPDSSLQDRLSTIVIGIDDNREQYFSSVISSIIVSHTVFSGGARHYQIMKQYLPEKHTWIPITVPLSDVFEQYKKHIEIVIFASGDPFFFGFANTLMREMPEAKIQVYPYFNSLQLLAHKFFMPYHDMHVVSLTGRPWHKFDEALIHGYDKIGVLTDNKEHTPTTIARRMLEYGYDNYTMFVGEKLGNSEEERAFICSLKDAAIYTFNHPNNLILCRTEERPRPFGISEKDFHLLNGRAKMITKMPIRLLSLNLLNLRNRKVFWDIGFCTGSVSIEAKMQFPHLQIVAFEQRKEGEKLIYRNMIKFGTPGIDTVIGDFTQIDISDYPKPDAVFIGGHGGKMDEIIAKVASLLSDDGVVVFNSVSEESKQMFSDAISANKMKLTDTIRIKVDDNNEIDVMKAIKRLKKKIQTIIINNE